jgi:hypothetical protein
MYNRYEKKEEPKLLKSVAVIIFKPNIQLELGWNDSRKLCDKYIYDIYQSSKTMVNYRIEIIKEVNDFPEFENGWSFANSTDYYTKFQRRIIPNTSCDYLKTIEKFHKDMPDVDEYWWFGAPYFGFYESLMFGKNPIWCNSPGLNYPSRNKIIMGFNYERGVGEMLEDFSHRTEFIMSYCKNYLWKYFLKDNGSVHCPPNTTRDYDWGNKELVETNCDAWYNWPIYENKRKATNCAEWGNGDIREHHKWWLNHLPKEWWKYICDLNIIEKQKLLFPLQNIGNMVQYRNKFKV